MESETHAESILLHGEQFTVVKPARLLAGMVLKSCNRDVYARIGPKQAILEEQIHTVSLYERGFPVARVLESGEYSSDEWFFTEESLGEKPFHTQFAAEWAANGKVSDMTFQRYLSVLASYVDAQFMPTNHTTITADEFVQATAPNDEIISNYSECGGNSSRYQQALQQATQKLRNAPMGVLQLDLNPYNILEKGVIDFEMVSYGPLGYDTLLVSLWHRWFSNDTTQKYCMAYQLSEQQMHQAEQLVITAAHKYNVTSPTEYMQEFLLIKTAWAFSSDKLLKDEPVSKHAFYAYRASILSNAVDAYLANTPIDALSFPDIRA